MKIVRFAHSLFLPESFYTSKAHFGKRFRRSVQRPQTAPNSQMRPALSGRLRLSTFGMHDCIPATHADAAALPVGHVLYCVARGTSRITRDQNAMSQRARARVQYIIMQIRGCGGWNDTIYDWLTNFGYLDSASRLARPPGNIFRNGRSRF